MNNFILVAVAAIAIAVSPVASAADETTECIRSSTVTGTASTVCLATIGATVPVCGAAPFTAAFDFGSATALCLTLAGTAAVSCGVTPVAMTVAIKDCLFD